jgi:hypothetical protein
MFHHLLHPLKVLWNERIRLFLPIWALITAAGVIFTLRILGRRPHQSAVGVLRPIRRHWSQRSTAALLVLVLFLVFYSVGILFWEGFTYYDNSHFTNETLIGRNVPHQVSPDQGRFWPLGYQEFNLLRHVSHSIGGYHGLRIVELLLTCTVLLFLDEEIPVWVRIFLIFVLLITPSIAISFSGLIYAEANILLWLAILVWAVSRFERTRSIAWSVVAVISVQVLLYYKEMTFLFLLGFTIGRLLLRCVGKDGPSLNFKRLGDRESRLDICLGAMVIPYIIYYLAAMFPVFGTAYSKESALPFAQVLSDYLALDVLAWIFAAIVLARVSLILRRRVEPSEIWDGLALGGFCYFAGYISLHMVSSYYLAPVDLIAVLYLGRLAWFSVRSVSMTVRLCFALFVCLVLCQDVSLTAFRMYERKNVVHAKAEMAEVINARYQSDPGDVRRLFFPFATPFQILEFASYLSYIGVPVDEQTANGGDRGILLVGNEVETDGPCGYRVFVCRPGRHPQAGDLVIVFPDDVTTKSASAIYQQAGPSQLFFYASTPSIPNWVRPFVNRMHMESPIFRDLPLPDSWLRASIALWN